MENHKLLLKIPIFTDLTEKELSEIEALLKAKNFKRGDVICSHEAFGDSLYIISEGKVKVALYSEQGKEIILSILNVGDFFGEMALLDGEPRSATVIAQDKSTLLVLERTEFLKYLRESPDLAIKILTIMSRRLRNADEQIGNLALLDVYGRIVRFLIHLVKIDGKKIVEGMAVENLPTHQEIAGMVGTSRETVSRTLSDLKKKGIITIDGKRVVIGSKALNEVIEKYSY